MNARKEIYVVDVGVGKAVENYLTQLIMIYFHLELNFDF